MPVWGMPSYHVLFLDPSNHIASTDAIECDTDGQVQARANFVVQYCGYPGIEVWDCGRLVCRVRKVD